MAQRYIDGQYRQVLARQRPRRYYPRPKVAGTRQKRRSGWLKYALVELGFLGVLGIIGLIIQSQFGTSATTDIMDPNWGYMSGRSHDNIGPLPPRYLSDMGVILSLQDQGLPITVISNLEVSIYPTIDIRRPNQPISASNWKDARLVPPDHPSKNVKDGGGIEIWSDNASAQKRMEYLQLSGRYVPGMVEYDYVRRNVLLRLSKSLTPDQAMAYVKALERVLMKWH